MSNLTRKDIIWLDNIFTSLQTGTSQDNNPMQQVNMKANTYHKTYFTVINVKGLPDVAVFDTERINEILLLIEIKSHVKTVNKCDGMGHTEKQVLASCMVNYDRVIFPFNL